MLAKTAFRTAESEAPGETPTAPVAYLAYSILLRRRRRRRQQYRFAPTRGFSIAQPLRVEIEHAEALGREVGHGIKPFGLDD
jgi:hypothetical protein